MFRRIKTLSKKGILSMNARNGDYIQKYNPRKNFDYADSKFESKKLAQSAGIQVPELYALIKNYREIKTVNKIFENLNEFVIKPEHGSGGEGILVLQKSDSGLQKLDGSNISDETIRHHLTNILSGLYSLGEQPDRAMIEYKINFDPVFSEISYKGTPDIRIIIYRGVPVMAMLRLPTESSGGRANLHQGAIGVGVDIRSGKTLNGFDNNNVIEIHPDTGGQIKGVQIKYWQRIIEDAAKCYDIFELGYMGVDIVLDDTFGPMLLEVNVRPGLAIQLANQVGLKTRLNLVDLNHNDLNDIDERIEFAQTHFH